MQAEHFRKILSARKLWCAIVLVLLISISTSFAAEKQISKIEVSNQSDKVVVNLTGNFPLKYTLTKTGTYKAFRFNGVIVPSGRVIGIKSGKIWNIKYSNFSTNPPISSVVVNSKSSVDYSYEYSTDKKQLTLTFWKGKKTAVAANAVPKPAVEKKVCPAVKPAPKPIVKQVVKAKDISAKTDFPSDNFKSIKLDVKPGDPEVEIFIPITTPAQKSAAIANPIEPVMIAPIEKKVSVNFLNADINDVFKALSIQSGKNIVASKDVSGNVTVSLANVSLDEAMDYVAKLSGYSYTKAGATYLVATRKTLDDMAGTTVQKSVTEMIRLSYAKSEDVIALVAPRYPDVKISKLGAELTGLASMDATGLGPAISLRNNLLVLMGPEKSVQDAKLMIEGFEASFKEETVQGVIKIYKLKYVNGKDLARSLMQLIPGIAVTYGPTEGFDLSAPRGVKLDAAGSEVVKAEETADQKSTSTEANQGAGGKSTEGPDMRSRVTTIETMGRPRSIIIAGRESEVNNALALAAQLDIKFPQVKIEAKITTITDSAEKKLGFLWEWDQIGFLESRVYQTIPGADKPSATDIGGKGWNRSMTNFATTLEAMAKNGDVNILATPSLTLLEGKPGVFFVGDDVTYVSFIETTATGKNIRTESRQVGIQLRAIASVSPDDFITLNLHPEVSVLKLLENSAAGMSLPVVTTRFTDHTIRVKNGDTFVIGGLIRSDDIKDLTKVPILGDIPIIGQLFKHSSTSKQKTEVVMFIKVTIMKD